MCAWTHSCVLKYSNEEKNSNQRSFPIWACIHTHTHSSLKEDDIQICFWPNSIVVENKWNQHGKKEEKSQKQMKADRMVS